MSAIFASPLFWIISIPFALLVLAIGVYLWCWVSDKDSGKTKAFRVCVSALILSIVLCCVYAFLDNLFVLDRSARIEHTVLLWHGTEYLPVSGCYDTDDRVAMTEGGSTLYNIKGDKGNRFIAIKFSEHYRQLYAKKGVSVAKDGDITLIKLDGKEYKQRKLLTAIKGVLDSFQTSYVYTDKEIWRKTDDKKLYNVDIYYNNSPVGVITPDYIGSLNGKLVYAKRQASTTAFTYDVFVLDKETADILNEYLP